MEPYQYWTIAGFIFLILEIMTLRTFPLVLAGAALFSAVVAYKFPDLYLIQIITCLCFIPIILSAIKPFIKKKELKKEEGKNEHK